MVLSLHQSAGQNHVIKIGNRWFENVAQFRYLGTKITNQNPIHEEIKRRLNLATDPEVPCSIPSATRYRNHSAS
jgi:hypothetical protein